MDLNTLCIAYSAVIGFILGEAITHDRTWKNALKMILIQGVVFGVIALFL